MYIFIKILLFVLFMFVISLIGIFVFLIIIV